MHLYYRCTIFRDVRRNRLLLLNVPDDMQEVEPLSGEAYGLIIADLSAPEPSISLGDALVAAVLRSALAHAADLSHHRDELLPDPDESAAAFFSSELPEVNFDHFLDRVHKYSRCSNSVLVWALLLLRRLERTDHRLRVSPYNVHRLLITAIMIAAKYVDNAWYSNSYYARVGGVATVAEMNRLELEMLKLLNFNVHVSVAELLRFCYDQIQLSCPAAQTRLARM